MQAIVVPMRLYATWEVDRSQAAACVPRLCTMRLTRLMLSKPVEQPDSSLVVAVRMQGSKRILRSNDICFSCEKDQRADVVLNIEFIVQYPHFVKRKGNSMLMLLQRRKKYKNRPIPGFKTLAVGSLNMTEVLQCYQQRELLLHCEDEVFAKVLISGLQTQPVELDDSRPREAGLYSDDEEEESSNEDGSDSEPLIDEEGVSVGLINREAHHMSGRRPKFRPAARLPYSSRVGQRNFKSKFVALLKKFKVSEEALSNADGEVESTQQEIQSLIEELENLSDGESGLDPEGDSVSIKSTPKPSLRPYFRATTSREELPMHYNNGLTISEGSKESEEFDQDEDGDLSDPVPLAGNQTAPSVSQCVDQPGASVSFAFGAPNGHHPPTVIKAGQVVGTTSSGVGIHSSFDSGLSGIPPINSGVGATVTAGGAVPHSGTSAYTRGDQFRATGHVSTLVSPPSNPASGPLSSHGIPSVGVVGITHSSGDRRKGPRYSISGVIDADIVSQFRSKTNSNSESSPVIYIKAPPIQEQLSSKMPSEEMSVPQRLYILSGLDVQSDSFVQALSEEESLTFIANNQADVKAILGNVTSRIQRFCNTNNVAPLPSKIGFFGGDRFLSFCLRVYVEVFAHKSTEWLHYLRFFVIPTTVTGTNNLSRILCSCDNSYANLLCDLKWRDMWDSQVSFNLNDCSELVNRISYFVGNAPSLLQLPIAEAMLQCKNGGDRDESSQLFIPFVMDVRVGASEATTVSELTTGEISSPTTPRDGGQGSPPASPHITALYPNSGAEVLDLQIEYWSREIATSIPNQSSAGQLNRSDSQPPASARKDAPSIKSTTLKTSFRSMVISKTCSDAATLSLAFTKEKKQQKMFPQLRMKNKEKAETDQSRAQVVRNITRLICSSKQHAVMKVTIDGVEWMNVKYFQISAQWPTHVKFWPLGVWNSDLSSVQCQAPTI